MTLTLANVAIILGFILCIAAAMVLAFRSRSETPDD